MVEIVQNFEVASSLPFRQQEIIHGITFNGGLYDETFHDNNTPLTKKQEDLFFTSHNPPLEREQLYYRFLGSLPYKDGELYSRAQYVLGEHNTAAMRAIVGNLVDRYKVRSKLNRLKNLRSIFTDNTISLDTRAKDLVSDSDPALSLDNLEEAKNNLGYALFGDYFPQVQALERIVPAKKINSMIRSDYATILPNMKPIDRELEEYTQAVLSSKKNLAQVREELTSMQKTLMEEASALPIEPDTIMRVSAPDTVDVEEVGTVAPAAIEDISDASKLISRDDDDDTITPTAAVPTIPAVVMDEDLVITPPVVDTPNLPSSSGITSPSAFSFKLPRLQPTLSAMKQKLVGKKKPNKTKNSAPPVNLSRRTFVGAATGITLGLLGGSVDRILSSAEVISGTRDPRPSQEKKAILEAKAAQRASEQEQQQIKQENEQKQYYEALAQRGYDSLGRFQRTDNFYSNNSDRNDIAFLWSFQGPISLTNTMYALSDRHPQYIDALQQQYSTLLQYTSDRYHTANDISLFSAAPHDRHIFNDDNIWPLLQLARAYKQLPNQDQDFLNELYVTLNNKYPQIASDWASHLAKPGGIYWINSASQRMNENYRSMVSNAPVIEAGVRLYQATGDRKYLDGDGKIHGAKEIYSWIKRYLRTAEGLYYDGLGPDGSYSADSQNRHAYNEGTMIGAGTLLYETTNDITYLQDAYQTLSSSIEYYKDHFLDGLVFTNIFFRNALYFSAKLSSLPQSVRESLGSFEEITDLQQKINHQLVRVCDELAQKNEAQEVYTLHGQKGLITHSAIADLFAMAALNEQDYQTLI